MGIYMSTLTQFLPQTGIKSVQRGLITISTSSYFNTATISAVNLSKSYINYLGSANPGGSSGAAADILCRMEFDSSTQVAAIRSGNGNGTTVSYEVVEFN
jgi:hypothetical protein